MSSIIRLKSLTLRKGLARYLHTESSQKKGYMQEFYRIRVIIRHPLVDKDMSNITSVDIAAYRDDRLSQTNPRTGKAISGNTVRLELALLSSVFAVASVEWGTCRHNPVASVRKPKLPPGRDRRLTASEERRIARYFQERNRVYFIIFQLALETAMRQGEILSLRWEHIDLQHGVAHLPHTKNGASRDVPLSRKARNLLQMLPAHLEGNVFLCTPSGLKSAWRLALQALKIVNLHFHDLRHEAISRLFELGTLNVMEVAAISGHRSLNMLKRYTHLRAYQLVPRLDARRRQVQKIAPYFVPYPATITHNCPTAGMTEIALCDFEGLVAREPTQAAALERASEMLLRVLAMAAQKGERVPAPGELPAEAENRILVCPLNSGRAAT
ncbi:site-specific integrase [Klebsiella sp. PL-2018]|uniref:site-specific integrase n=1 Tax=Klebsiella TaxID=570 RepID=UPI001C21DEF0|nr:site-specific integrase [Klebsiella sp. PL-2018]QXD00975.1 Shufflon-specific DNA recombinase [Klebsiella sp. PL-2018]